MVYLGLDIGARRVGVALSDPAGGLAVALTVIELDEVGIDSDGGLARSLASIVEERAVDALVLGLPLRTDGSEGPEAQAIRRIGADLGSALALTVEFTDERFTTRIAEAGAREIGVSTRKAKRNVDRNAAAIILQGYLDSRRRTAPGT